MYRISLFILVIMLGAFCPTKLPGQTVEELMAMAVENNPQLKALYLEFEAAQLRGPQISQLPDPVIGIAAPALRPETRLGSQVLMVSATQMFPWFGSLKAREDVVLSMAQSRFEQATAAKLELYYTIKVAYDQLWMVTEKQKVVRENISVYKALENVSLAKVESGKATLADVLRVRLMIQELENQIEILENQKQKFHARINEATNRPMTDTVFVVTPLDSMVYLPEDFAVLKEKVEANHPIINQLNLAIETSEKEVRANKLSGLPSIGVGLDYALVQPRTDMIPDGNGRDILIPKVTVSIPISRKKYNAREQEELIRQDIFAFQKEAVVNSYVRKLQEYKADYDEALLKLELFGAQRKTSQSAIDVLLSYYSSQGSRFDEILQLQNQLLTYDMGTISAVAQMHIAKAGIDLLTDF